MNINKASVIPIRATLNRLKLLNDFELTFLTSLLRKNYTTLKVSPKQFSIFDNLNKRYQKLDIYDRYTDWFRINGIVLNDFEQGYLETYKGEINQTDDFRTFLKQTINKPK